MLFTNKMPVGHYVYAYLRNKTSKNGEIGSPYYIGKGSNRRAWAKHTVPIPKNQNLIVIVAFNLTDLGACAIERRLIKWYGRQDIGTGILHNRTDGGDGIGNWYTNDVISIRASSCPVDFKPGRMPPTAESRAKISASNKGKIMSAETRTKQSIAALGRKRSVEFCQKMSEIAKNRQPPTAESRAKNSASNKGKIVSAESRAKNSASNKGKIVSAETRAKQSVIRKGKTQSIEHRLKNSTSNSGPNNHAYGKKWYNDGIKNYLILGDPPPGLTIGLMPKK